MSNTNNNFSERIKVDLSKSNNEKKPFSGNYLYFLSHLMKDTNLIKNFLLYVHDEYNISTDEATNYYYSINHQLAEIDFDVRKGKIDGSQLADRLNSICQGHKLDFNHLISTTDKITSLSRTPNPDEMISFANELEAIIIEEHRKEDHRQQ